MPQHDDTPGQQMAEALQRAADLAATAHQIDRSKWIDEQWVYDATRDDLKAEQESSDAEESSWSNHLNRVIAENQRLQRMLGNQQAQVAYMCEEIAKATKQEVATPADTVASVRTLMQMAELGYGWRDERDATRAENERLRSAYHEERRKYIHRDSDAMNLGSIRAQLQRDLDARAELAAIKRENMPANMPPVGLIERARHEVSEDRRIAGLMAEAKNRQALLQRAQVTEDLITEVVGLDRRTAPGMTVTRCARCGEKPILVPEADPENSELEVCSHCAAQVATELAQRGELEADDDPRAG